MRCRTDVLVDTINVYHQFLSFEERFNLKIELPKILYYLLHISCQKLQNYQVKNI